MQYSPKLKTAMEQIKSILKEHDIAGFVVLHDERGFSEFLNQISPSYSCAHAEPEGIRIRIRQGEIGKEEARRLAEGTYNLIQHFARVIGEHALLYMDADNALTEKWGGSSDGGSFSSHTQQNT